MKPILAIIGARFRLLLQYRAAAFAGLITQLFFGILLVTVMRTFYSSGGGVQPLPLADAVTYIWLGQAFFSLLPLRADPEIKSLVMSGGIAYELLRPVNLYAWWFARAIALKSAPVLMRAAPLFLVAGAFLDFRFPSSAGLALLWLLALVGAIALASTMIVLMNISLLWTLSGEGVQYVVPVLSMLLSGLILPLPLFPDWMHPVIAFLPFRGLNDTPNRIWLGDFPLSEALLAIGQQWVWVAILAALGYQLLSRGLQRVVIQGG